MLTFATTKNLPFIYTCCNTSIINFFGETIIILMIYSSPFRPTSSTSLYITIMDYKCRICTLVLLLIVTILINLTCTITTITDAFVLSTIQGNIVRQYSLQQGNIDYRHKNALHSENSNNNEGDSNSPKKKRRRKQQQSTTSTITANSALQLDEQTSASSAQSSQQQIEINESILDNDNDETLDLEMMKEIAKFEFQKKDTVTSSTGASTSVNTLLDMQQPQSSATSTSTSSSTTVPIISNAIPLPDIKEARKKKQMDEEMIRIQAEQEQEQKIRIKRTDKEAFRRLLEQQPFADADDSYFEEEQYGAVSALLGERAKPFLSIPFGPLQVGHFIGSLVFVLMAYIEYPGFPLTNLPTPLREAFQGGLGTVYSINTILAIIVAVKVAPDRGQPIPLWVMKTFTVGGLAFDQILQLPTLAEIEKANSIKGARAIKKKSSSR